MWCSCASSSSRSISPERGTEPWASSGLTGSPSKSSITVGIAAEERAAIGDPPIGHGLLGALIRDANPLRIPDIAADPRSVGFPPHHPPMRSLLGAPIAGRGRVFGNIYLTDKRGVEAFDDEDQRVLVILATQAAVAV